MNMHTIVGAGAVGSGTAIRLAEQGHDVRVITRTGTGPANTRIELVSADASDAKRLTELSAGAEALYNCANPPYNKWATAWPVLGSSFIATAEATGARLITMSNLYGFGRGTMPMRATDALAPFTKKGQIRSDMWHNALQAHRDGRIQATEVRASDYFGPGLGETSHLGDRLVPRLLAGKNVSVIGATDIIHSWSYIGDVCDTMATLGTDDGAMGRAWHVPTLAPVTAAEMVRQLCRQAGIDPVQVKQIPKLALRAAGLIMPVMRELPEILYQFEEPFEIDGADTTETFGLKATPLDEQMRATIASYRTRAEST